MLAKKSVRRNSIHKRIRRRMRGTAEIPRLSVFRSNKEIYAQIINDVEGITVAAASSREKDFSRKLKKNEQAVLVGKKLAERGLAAGVSVVVFDRSGYLYHGRVKSLAEGAREAGLKF